MAQNPIGISFLPSAEAAAQGPERAGMEGDLGQAFKILSLQLPRVIGTRSIVPKELMPDQGGGMQAAQGNRKRRGGFNPYEAVIGAMLGGVGGGTPSPTFTPLGDPTRGGGIDQNDQIPDWLAEAGRRGFSNPLGNRNPFGQ